MSTPLKLLCVGLLAASLLLLGAPGEAWAQSGGKVLPELSGRRIGPGDDPRVQARRRARTAGRYREVRKRRRPRYRSQRLRGGGWRFFGAGWSADVAPDGTVTFGKRSVAWSWRRTEMTFDLTDAVMRGKKKDPYAAAKLRFMRETTAWRRGLRRAARRRALKAYFARLPGRLRTLWRRTDITTMRKRWLLFELWEECLEPGRNSLSVQAQQARWMILRFIRKHLPAAGPRAYTRRELSRMRRRRRGRIPFDPYGRLKRPVLPVDAPR